MAKFFSKENLHTAGWAILIGVLSFIGGLLWKHFDGPDEVKIIGDNTSKKDTTITIIKFEATDLEKGNNSQTNNFAKTNQPSKKSNYQFNPALVDSIIKQALAKQGQSSGSPEIKTVSSTAQADDNTAPLYRPQLSMPSIVTGYTEGQINSYATVNINKTIFIQNDFIELTTTFFDKSTINKITPFFVSIVKRNSEHSATLVWSDQFQPINTKTRIKFAASFPANNYELTIGFYLKNGLETKYPEFYSKKFDITIK